MPVFDPNRYKQLLCAQHVDGEKERSNAAGFVYRYLKQVNVHPNELDILHGVDFITRNQAAIARLQADLAALHNECAFLRRHVSPVVLRHAAHARAVDQDSYYQLLALAYKLWPDGEGLIPSWKRSLSTLTGCPLHEIGRWEAGLAAVPDEVLAALRTKVRGAERRRTRPAGNPVLSPQHMAIIKGVFDHSGSATILEITETLEKECNIDPEAEVRKKSSWRHPIHGRLAELHTRTRFGMALLSSHKVRSQTYYSVTEFGDEVYRHNLAMRSSK